MKGKSMVEGAPWKHILKFAFPVLLGSLLQQLYNTVDTIIVGEFLGWQAGILGSSSAEMKALSPFICENDIGKKMY